MNARTPTRPTAHLVARGLLIAVSVVVGIPAGFAALGAYAPGIRPFGAFGSVINTGLPWVVFALLVSSSAAGATVVLGGRKAVALLAFNLLALSAALFIGFRYFATAAQYGATYDVLRAADGHPPIGDAEERFVFATVDGVDLHAGIWLPAGADRAAAGSLPAVVFVHGGAFQGGGLWTRPTLMEAVNQAGIVAIDVEYRLAPPPRWDQAPGDVLCALAWVRVNASLRMVDPRRVSIVGESAGGNLAMVAGYAAGTKALVSSCPALGAAVIPAGVVAIAPTADLEGIWNDRTIFDFAGTQFPEAYIGGPPTAYPDRYAAAEPFQLLRPDLPPTMLIVAENDQFVLIDRQRKTYERIKASGASIQLIVVPFVVHGFDGEPNSFGAQLLEHLVPDYLYRLSGRTTSAS